MALPPTLVLWNVSKDDAGFRGNVKNILERDFFCGLIRGGLSD